MNAAIPTSTPIDTALRRLANGKAELADLEALTSAAEARGLTFVSITVPRTKPPPRHLGTLPLFGRRGGPRSSPDRTATRVNDRQWSDWWRVADLRAYLRAKGGRRRG